MIDQYNRVIDYLRISITDRCNFRCRYCMPESGVDYISHKEILSYEEILRLVRIAADIGIRKIKITGGEPFVRKGACSLIREICETDEIDSVTVTTNGALLSDHLPELIKAGVSGINVSLDTLAAERFYEITRRNELAGVLAGIEGAASSGIRVKINCVPMAGFNEDELADIAGLAKDKPLCVRFIELMPIGLGNMDKGISEYQVRARIEDAWGAMTETSEILGNGPAKYYRIPGFSGRIGFISAVSHEFCDSCNRVRLTSDGILKPCLNFESHIDLKAAMRSGRSDEELAKIFREGIYRKPSRHGFEEKRIEDIHENRRMAGIGG